RSRGTCACSGAFASRPRVPAVISWRCRWGWSRMRTRGSSCCAPRSVTEQCSCNRARVELLEERHDRRVPVERRRALAAVRGRLVAAGQLERGGEGVGERLWITEPGDDAGLVADQFLRRTIAGDDARGAARQRLDEAHPDG